MFGHRSDRRMIRLRDSWRTGTGSTFSSLMLLCRARIEKKCSKRSGSFGPISKLSSQAGIRRIFFKEKGSPKKIRTLALSRFPRRNCGRRSGKRPEGIDGRARLRQQLLKSLFDFSATDEKDRCPTVLPVFSRLKHDQDAHHGDGPDDVRGQLQITGGIKKQVSAGGKFFILQP